MPVEHVHGIENTLSMIFKQATGVPTSSHGYFLNHRIEALTISGVKSTNKKQNAKQNLLKLTRIIEGTLRSINNLLERFHQSFFFYLLPSSNTYISIGMYMPAFGLVSLPLLVQIASLWFELFIKKKEQKFDIDEKRSIFLSILRIIIANLSISILFGLLLYYGTSYFIYVGKMFALNSKESLLNCYMAITVNIFATPILVNAKLSTKSILDPIKREHVKRTSDNLLRLIIIGELVIFLGTLSVLNFSLAFLISLFYVPVTVLAVADISNILLKGLRLMILLVASPLFYFTILLMVYSVYINNNNNKLYEKVSDNLYDLAFLSKVSGIWTYDIINLCLIPIWSSLWLLDFPKF
jgi:glycosylphosphatidylinositol transamidase